MEFDFNVSLIRNLADALFDFGAVINPLGLQPQPAGEVAQWTSDTGLESVSIAANTPEV